MNWREEMNLLNDQQLKRIAYASNDSWGWGYDGKQCCIVGHILNRFNKRYSDDKHREITEYIQMVLNDKTALVGDIRTPLETEYLKVWHNGVGYIDKLTHPEIIEEIQLEAKRILEERKNRIDLEKMEKEIEIETT